MTKRLEELFDLPSADLADLSVEELKDSLKDLSNLEKELDLTDLSKSDQEMDELAAKAMTTFADLMDLGMNVEARLAAPVFEAASKMMGHALMAKTSKIDKKLRLMDLKLKEQRLVHQIKTSQIENEEPTIQGNGKILDRNELLRLLKNE